VFFYIVLRLEIWGYTDKAYLRRLILLYKLVSEILKNFNKYAVNTNVFAKKVKEFHEKYAKIDHNM